jgi:hypothetical protein
MRSLFGLLLLLLTPAVHAQEESWFPLQEGNTWQYSSKVKVKVEVGPFGDVKQKVGTPLRVTAVCGAPSMIEGELFYPVKWTDNTGALDTRVWIRSEGMQIHLARSIGGRLLLVPGDLSGSNGVRLKFAFGGKKVSLKGHTVGAERPINTQAGAFQAIPVASTLRLDLVKISTMVWYARGVGPVMISERVKLKGTDTTHSLQLVSFTPAQRAEVPPPPPYRQPPPPSQPPPPTHRQPPPPSQPPPARPPHAEPYPPAQPLQPRGHAGNGFRLVRELVANGQPEKWRELESLSAQATRLSAELGLTLQRGNLPDAQLVVGGLTSRTVLDDTLLVSDGSVQTVAVDGSFVFMNGDLTVSGDVLDSVVICSGDIVVTGTIKGSLILSRGRARTESYTKASLFQTQGVSATGFSNACIYVGTQRRVAQSRRDVAKAGPGPLNLFDGR